MIVVVHYDIYASVADRVNRFLTQIKLMILELKMLRIPINIVDTKNFVSLGSAATFTNTCFFIIYKGAE